MLRSMLRNIVAFLLVPIALAIGCGGPTFIVQQYGGSPRERETIAVIRVNGHETIVLVALDGEDIATRVPDDARLHVEVLPGKHTVTIGDLSDTAEPARTASFVALAGKTYRPVMQRHAARVFEVNPETDALVSDVTFVPPPVPERVFPPAQPPSPPPSEPAPVDGDAGSSSPGPDSGAD
jgi:hypothetical protein